MNQVKKIIVSVVFLLMGIFSNGQTLKVMTYNIRLDVASDGENAWSLRKDYFISQIQFYNPDVFGVQEARPNQVVDITTSLPEYNNVGIGRDGIGQGESSNIFYKKKDLQLKEAIRSGFLKHPIQFQKVGTLPTIEFVRMHCSKI